MCYMNSEDLQRFLSIPPVSSALWQQLAQCISDGHISGNGRVRTSFLISSKYIFNSPFNKLCRQHGGAVGCISALQLQSL